MNTLQKTITTGLVSLFVAGAAFAAEPSTKGSMVGNTKVETTEHEAEHHDVDCTKAEAKDTDACKTAKKEKKAHAGKAHKEEHHDKKEETKSGT